MHVQFARRHQGQMISLFELAQTEKENNRRIAQLKGWEQQKRLLQHLQREQQHFLRIQHGQQQLLQQRALKQKNYVLSNESLAKEGSSTLQMQVQHEKRGYIVALSEFYQLNENQKREKGEGVTITS